MTTWNGNARGCPHPATRKRHTPLGRCLSVIMKEECEHRRYAVRDLTVLEADLDGTTAHHDAPP